MGQVHARHQQDIIVHVHLCTHHTVLQVVYQEKLNLVLKKNRWPVLNSGMVSYFGHGNTIEPFETNR